MPNENNEARTVVFGQLTEESNIEDPKVKVTFNDPNKGTVERFILQEMIEHTEELSDGNIAFLLKSVQMKGANINVADVYQCAIEGSVQQDISDAWIEGQAVADIFPPVIESDDDVDDFDFDEVESDDDIDDFDDFDDSVPVTENAIELSTTSAVTTLPNDGDDSDDDNKKKLSAQEKAAKDAAKLREKLYAQVEDKSKELGLKTDIAASMLRGKRDKDFGPWNYRALRLPVDVRYPNPEAQQQLENEVAQICAEYVSEGKVDALVAELNAILPQVNTHIPMRDAQGNERVSILTNPTLAGKPMTQAPNSPKHPAYGAVLNRAMGPNFQHLDHPDLIIPIVEAVDDIEGVVWDAVSYDRGAKASLTIDISDMATKYRKDAAESLTGYLNLNANTRDAFLAEENGGHRCGVTIVNQNDGKGALAGYLTVMRTYCKNLAMRGSNELMFKVRHMSGSMAAFDVGDVAQKLRAAFLEAQQHLLCMGVLRNLPIEMQTFDRLLTAFDRQGLVTQPSVKVDMANYDKVFDKEGNPLPNVSVKALENISKVTHGHAWKAMNKGWIDPDLDFVKVEGDAVGTLSHAYNVVSGYLTHKPIFVDGNTNKPMTGTGEKMDNFMRKSGKATNFFEDIAHSAVATYCAHFDVDEIEDMQHFRQFFEENPSALKVPMKATKSAKKSELTSIEDIPLYQDTWKKTLIVENK
jgi:hypothetical protein